jgi:hypothetical protein
MMAHLPDKDKFMYTTGRMTREDLIEEPTEQLVMNRYNGWAFKIKQSSPLNQLSTDDDFWYGQILYQVKQVKQVSAAPESYIKAYCLEAGVMPPNELLPR